MFAVRNEETALDIVQDTMLKLAENYGDRPGAELAPLFQRILQNTIRDYYRRQKVRSLWSTLLGSLGTARDGGDEDYDPLETLQVEPRSEYEQPPAQQLEKKQLLEIIELAVSKLPARQREAFLMRYWEELDVADTAKIMGCSEGSVKTHCSRATHALAAVLLKQGITL